MVCRDSALRALDREPADLYARVGRTGVPDADYLESSEAWPARSIVPPAAVARLAA